MYHQVHVPCARCKPLYQTPQGPSFGTLVVRATHFLRVFEPESLIEEIDLYLCRSHVYLVPVEEIIRWEELSATGLDLSVES